MSRVELRTSGRSAFIQVDGTDISAAVRAVRLCVDAGHVARVVVELASVDLVTGLDGAKVGLTPRTHAALVALGWEPPAPEPASVDGQQELFSLPGERR